MPKELYASLEIAEREVRVLVSECYNTRFNILQVAQRECSGISDYEINDPEKVKNAILCCMNDVREKTGTKLEKVILLIPPIHYARIPLKSSIVPDEKGLSKDDVLRALNKTLNIKVDPSLLVINRIPVSYTINGITSKRVPLKEIAKEAEIDIDLLCADKKIAFDYVSIVEECGLKVMDICLSNYAICKEASLFEQSLTQNIILLDLNDSYTNMSLIGKGKLLSCEHLNRGLESFVKDLYEKYPIPYKNLLRLVKYNASKNNNSDDMIYAYTSKERNYNICRAELNQMVLPPTEKYIDEIIEMCSPIIESGKTSFYIASEGTDMVLVADILSEKSKCEVKILHPDVIGARISNMIALYGCLFAEKDYLELSEKSADCLNEFEFNSVVDRKKFEEEGETFTAKIRMFFKQNMDKEKQHD